MHRVILGLSAALTLAAPVGAQVVTRHDGTLTADVSYGSVVTVRVAAS